MYFVVPGASFDAVAAGVPSLVARNNHILVGLDDATVESLLYAVRMPSTYSSGSNVSVSVSGYAASATTGTARIRLEFDYIVAGTTDIDSDSFAAAQEANATAVSPSGALISASFSLSSSNMDDIAAGGLMWIRVSRVGDDDTNDTMTGDFQLQDIVFSQ